MDNSLDMSSLMSMFSNIDKNQLNDFIKNNNISPDKVNNLFNSLNSNSNEKSSKNQTSNGIDIETIMKMKSIIEKMNTKDDPRSNLLQSLKPYLNDNRKSKVDQYIQLMNMSKVLDVFPFIGGEQKHE